MVKIDFLIVAGGGGGGRSRGGGGGAGGYIYQTGQTIYLSSYNVVVGTGGAGSTTAPGVAPSGLTSSFASLTAIGGGGGGGINALTGMVSGGTGGSGGGGAGNGALAGFGGVGGNGTSPQGYGGGRLYSDNSTYSSAGGGGGSSEAGSDANSSGTRVAGKGGNGIANSISGVSVTYAAGGGGGADGTGVGGAGGTGGGGAGSNTGAGANATGYGCGGGGGASAANGGSGSNGIVIVRLLTSDFINTSGGIITTDGDYTVHSFTTSGTLTLTYNPYVLYLNETSKVVYGDDSKIKLKPIDLIWLGLQGYWSLNETTGATVVYPTYGSVTGTPSNVTWEAGKNQNCVKFDGTNTSNTSLINFGVVSQYSYEYTQPWSWSMWIKRTRQGSVLDCLICNLELSIGTGCFDMYIFNNLVYINIWQTSTKYVSNVSSTAFWTDTTSWHHLVFTYNGNNAQSGILGYYDGTSITWGTGKASNIDGTIVNTGNLYFGERSTQGAKILFDEAGLWNRVLTTTEITELYNSGSGKFY